MNRTHWRQSSGDVHFKNHRALNPRVVAPVKQFRADTFEVNCRQNAGRYLPFWQRD